ncbi:MAG: zinc-ribbon domain-containing protein [Candidatus Omnitrophica bacterium]|nr:zinc-ribbon domain-containing protein [Candidatus Omnitrophota bacterium]
MPQYICPHCNKPINDDDAILCLYCGESLDRCVGKRKLIIAVIAILVITSFIILLVHS